MLLVYVTLVLIVLICLEYNSYFPFKTYNLSRIDIDIGKALANVCRQRFIVVILFFCTVFGLHYSINIANEKSAEKKAQKLRSFSALISGISAFFALLGVFKAMPDPLDPNIKQMVEDLVAVSFRRAMAELSDFTTTPAYSRILSNTAYAINQPSVLDNLKRVAEKTSEAAVKKAKSQFIPSLFSKT